MSITNTFLVDVDGTTLADDVKALLTSAYVDDSQRLPDMFELRFRDPAKTVLSDTGAQVGSTVRVSVMTSTSQTPVLLMEGEVTALEAEFDTGGTFIVMRGYDPAHRLFRGRGTYAYTQMTASDIAQKVAKRAGLRTGTIASTSTVFEHVSQAGTSDWDLLDGLARDVGYEISVREDGFTFGPPTKSGNAPEGHGADQAETEPLVLHLGSDLLRFRAVVTSAGQVKEIEVRGWDVGTKAALKATAPAKTESATLTTSPQDLAHTFGDPVYVSTDVPHRTQAEVDAAAAALAEEIAGTFAEFDGVAIGNPDVRAGVAVTLDNLGDFFDGKYTVTRSRHRFDPTTGYTTAFSVTGAHDRSMLSLAGGATRPPAAPRGVVIGQVNDVNDPEEQGRVTLMFPWLSDDYVSSWARTVHAGAGKDRGAMVLPEVGDEVLVAFEQGDFRRPYVIGGLYNGVDTPSRAGVPWVDSGSGAVNRRSVVSRNGHRIDLLDQDGQAEGITISSKDESVSLLVDASNTKVTVHSDGTVLVEGSQGIVIDAASSSLELKGGDISIEGSRAVSIKGGSNVSVEAGSQLQLQGSTAALQASGVTEVKGSLVKIN
jgi:phage protein D/phage baseplate assembly protein gpV